jgi:uncharacterized membrane protein
MFEEIYLAQIFAWVVVLAIGLVLVGFILRWRRNAESAHNRNRIDELRIQFESLRIDTEKTRAEGTRNLNKIETQLGDLRIELAKERLREARARADMAENQRDGRKTDSSIIIPHPEMVRRMTRR